MRSLLTSFVAPASKQLPCTGIQRVPARKTAAAALLLVALLAVLSACATPTTTAGGKSTSPATATTPPTATPKPKPTSVPTTSVAFCQGLLSLGEVNSIMKPAAPATNILVVNDTSLSACSWAQGQVIAVFAVFFAPFPAGTSLQSAAKQQLAKAHVPAGTSLSVTPVSGVGDQALYVSASIPTPAGVNYVAEVAAADGGILLGCAQTGAGPVPAGAEPELAQACQLVISRL